MIAVPRITDADVYDKAVLNTTMDICQMLGSFLTNYALKTILKNVELYSNWRIGCPNNPGNFTVTDFGGIESFIPELLKPFVIPSKFKIEITVSAIVEGFDPTPKNISYMQALGRNYGSYFGKK